MILPFSGGFLWLHYKKSLVHSEMQEKISNGSENENQLIKLALDRDESEKLIQWESYREFEYKKVLYDVVKTKIHGDSIYFYCLLDVEETQLEKELEHLFSYGFESEEQRDESQNNLTCFYQNLFHSRERFSTNNLLFTDINVDCPPYKFYLNSCVLSPLVPPPEFV